MGGARCFAIDCVHHQRARSWKKLMRGPITHLEENEGDDVMLGRLLTLIAVYSFAIILLMFA